MAMGVEVDVVILTALGLEYDAVRAHLADTRQHTDANGTRYELGTPRSGSGRVALALIGEGNLAAAAVTSRAIDEFGPKVVIFAGVAGGLTNSVALGDVVVATRIHAYHGGRDEPAGFRPRPKSWPLAHALEQAAREVARASPSPTVHFKPIVSGEVVIDTRDSHLARLIADHYSDAVAADMESAGVAEAAHRNGFHNTITIRGISDNADGGKRHADAAGWQSIAAARAAVFAVALAERIAQAPPSTWCAAFREHADQPPVSQTTVHAAGSLTMKRSIIAGGNVTQSRTVRIGLGGTAAALLVAVALVIANSQDSDPSSPDTAGPPPVRCDYPDDPLRPTARDVGRPTFDPDIDGGPVDAEVVTSLGTLTLRLDGAKAPCTVASFRHLAESGYYDGVACHNLKTGPLYILQCGDPGGTGGGGPGYVVADENLPRDHVQPRGTVVLNNAGRDTGGGIFSIVYEDSELGTSYPILGELRSGMDVVDRVARAGHDSSAQTSSPSGHPNLPLTFESITVRAAG